MIKHLNVASVSEAMDVSNSAFSPRHLCRCGWATRRGGCPRATDQPLGDTAPTLLPAPQNEEQSSHLVTGVQITQDHECGWLVFRQVSGGCHYQLCLCLLLSHFSPGLSVAPYHKLPSRSQQTHLFKAKGYQVWPLLNSLQQQLQAIPHSAQPGCIALQYVGPTYLSSFSSLPYLNSSTLNNTAVSGMCQFSSCSHYFLPKSPSSNQEERISVGPFAWTGSSLLLS